MNLLCNLSYHLWLICTSALAAGVSVMLKRPFTFRFSAMMWGKMRRVSMTVWRKQQKANDVKERGRAFEKADVITQKKIQLYFDHGINTKIKISYQHLITYTDCLYFTVAPLFRQQVFVPSVFSLQSWRHCKTTSARVRFSGNICTTSTRYQVQNNHRNLRVYVQTCQLWFIVLAETLHTVPSKIVS